MFDGAMKQIHRITAEDTETAEMLVSSDLLAADI